MDHLSLTQRWLRQNIQPYSHKDIVYNHIDTVLAANPTLRPKTDVYTFDDGRSQLLLCIHGLLPIQYRRAAYNIPVTIWLTLQYPIQPPIVYVVPTSDMLVKGGKFIDVSGRCEPDYIHAWQKKSEGCNLKALVDVLIDQFSREPPLYTKPRHITTPPPREKSMPITSNHSSSLSQAAPRSNGATTTHSSVCPPTPPPRPMPIHDSSIRVPTRSPPPTAPHSSNVPRQNIYHPPRLTSTAVMQNPPIYYTPPNQTASPPSQIRTSSATYYSPPPPPPPTHLHHHSQPLSPQQRSPPSDNVPTHHTGPPPPSSAPIPAPIPTPVSAQPHPPSSIPPVPPTPARNYLDEDIDDTPTLGPPPSNAPPRPPNPEVLRIHTQLHTKFISEFAALEQALATDMQRLQTAQSDLLAGEPAIRDEMARLEAVRDVCRVVADRYRSTVNGAEMNLYELRRKGDPEVDELICSTTIVYNQLINLVAEDNAIEDTIYHLHRALNAGRMDLDKFLRTTRSLAEEQFMKRALVAKIVNSISIGAWR